MVTHWSRLHLSSVPVYSYYAYFIDLTGLKATNVSNVIHKLCNQSIRLFGEGGIEEGEEKMTFLPFPFPFPSFFSVVVVFFFFIPGKA